MIYSLSSNIKQTPAECERLQYESVRGENKPVDLQYLWWMTQTNLIKRVSSVPPVSKNNISFNKLIVISNSTRGFYMTTNEFP